MNIPYTFHDKLILRSPHFGFKHSLSETAITDILKDKKFLEAVYLASPVLYNECIKLKEGKIKTDKEIEKITASLVKYYQRMYSRCTPFGLFAGCAVINWSKGKANIMYNDKDIFRSTRLDMQFLYDLAQNLALLPVVKNRLRYFPNSSIYRLADEICYVEYKYINNVRQYMVSAVLNSDYLQLILKNAATGITIDEMSHLLINKTGVSTEEANTFIDDLIQGQILINELEPAITGKEVLQQIVEVLHRINLDKNSQITQLIALLRKIEDKIKILDSNIINDIATYKNIVDDIKKLNIPYDEGKLFQTDLFRNPENHTLSDKIQNSLLQAFSFLNGLYYQDNNNRLTEFAKKFEEKYGDKEIPLLLALETDIGIPYANNAGKDISPLLQDTSLLPNNPDKNLIQWHKKQQGWFIRKLEQAFKENLFEIEVNEEDIKHFPPKWKDLPPSISVWFRLINDNKIFLENVCGSSAVNLISRYATGNKDIKQLIENIINEEEKQNDEIIFAEIIHLPENRVANILLHPAFRTYEIPFLAKSSLEYQIPLSDLYVSVNNGYIKLFSKSLNKEIIPRLSNAHDYSKTTLPVYYFLCDLQTQRLRSVFNFHWGSMANQFSFLPRLVYKEVILFEATWQLSRKNFEILLQKPDDENILSSFIEKWRLPRYITLVDNDNKLLVDLQNKGSVGTFLHTIKNRIAITLKEFYLPNEQIVKDEKGNFYNNEFIASLIKTEKVYSSNPLNSNKCKIQHDFSPGSEWVYYKLYCGVKSADKILSELIYPLIVKFLSDKIIDKWFFVRYNDPEFHLRLRFHLTDKNNFADFIKAFSSIITDFEQEKIIWKTDLSTYQREINRYTPAAMELSESLFFIDSMQKLVFLKATAGDERENIRWLWGIKTIDQLLCAFNFSIQEKFLLLQTLKDNFAKEFNVNTTFFQQLNKKYRVYKTEIGKIIKDEEVGEVRQILKKIFDKKKYNFENIAAQILTIFKSDKFNETFNNLVSSYIHMSLNRLFISNPRAQEMIVYDFLLQYYNGEVKRKKQYK